MITIMELLTMAKSKEIRKQNYIENVEHNV